MADHDLRLGDCLDPISGLASLSDKSVDHVICDPPYEAEAHTLQRRVKPEGWRNGAVTTEVPISFGAISEAERSAVALEMGRLARRWVLVFCQAEAGHLWRAALVARGLTYKRSCVWIKPDGQPQLTGDRPGMGYETIVAAHGDGRSRWNAGGKLGVYSFVRNQNGVHPTQKPSPLMEALISDFTDPGEIVLDPFAGSGTTGVACKKLHRRFIGWERDPKFHAAAVKRIEAAREQYELIPRGPKPKQTKLGGV